MAAHTEGICVRCDSAFVVDDAQVSVTIESSDIGCFRNVEKSHVLCGPCYSEYLRFMYEDV
jgi:hypothetical protein